MSAIRIHVAANNVGSFVEVDGVRLKGVRAVSTQSRVGQVATVTVELFANPLDITIEEGEFKQWFTLDTVTTGVVRQLQRLAEQQFGDATRWKDVSI